MKAPVRGLLLCGALLAARAAAFEADIRAAGASHFLYEPLTLEVRVTGAQAPVLREPPEIPGAQILSVDEARPLPPGPGHPGGHALRIEIVPERDGMLAIPPLVVADGNRTAATPALRVAVRSPRRATEMDLAVSVDRGNATVDQTVTLAVRWTCRVPLPRCRGLDFDLPVLHDPRLTVFPLDPGVPEADRIGLPVGGQRVIAGIERGETANILTFRYRVVPRQPGVISGGAARLACSLLVDKAPATNYPSYFDNHFFARPGPADNYEEVYLEARVPPLTVKALPEAGRSPLYAGIAGPCSVAAEVAPARLVTGQPALLTVTLGGLECPEAVAGLPGASLDALDADFHLVRTPLRESTGAAQRTFTYTLRPLRAGISAIPAIPLQVFDPARARFVTVRSRPLAISVAPDGKVATYQPPPPVRAPLAPAPGIRQNRNPSPVMTLLYDVLETLARLVWPVLALPPLVWLALRPLARRLDRCRRDPAYARAVRAERLFHRGYRRDPARAWRGFLADRLGLDAGALTGGTVSGALRGRNADPALIGEVARVFVESDSAVYAPTARGSGPASDLAPLVRRIVRATAPLAVILLLLGTPAAASPAPGEIFETAMKLRAEKPDEARPRFIDAALGFEQGGDFLNAGNSWWFAGEEGRALANFRSAESRAPFDPQIRESIGAILARRGPVAVVGTHPPGRLAAAWTGFCRWSKTLRLGLFLACYLAAWAAFIAARLAGRRLPPAVCATLALALLLPAVSLAATAFTHPRGVILQPAEARLGPGYAYDPAFDQPLPEASEFDWLESCNGWVRARLDGGAEAWLPAPACFRPGAE